MDAHNKVRLNTMKEIMRIRNELYGRSGALPRLQQVVKDKYYHRGDHSPIICSKCGSKLSKEESINYSSMCNKCEDLLSLTPYPEQNWEQHNKSMLNGMVLSNSCDYERWS